MKNNLSRSIDLLIISFLSVLLSLLIMFCAQYYYFLPQIEKMVSSDASDSAEVVVFDTLKEFLPKVKDLKQCSELIDGKQIQAGTACIMQPNKIIQTYSAIKIWNYADKEWQDLPDNEAGKQTILNPIEMQSSFMSPLILSCPWGCTLGYL